MMLRRMIELLDIEHQCMLRKSCNGCDGKCENCELVQDDGELNEMYTDVIRHLQREYDAIDLRCRANLRNDLIDLLKEQEPAKPTLDIRHGKSMWRCGSCSTALQPNQIHAKFCFNCGQAVKWE